MLCALDVETGRLGCFVTREGHHALLGQFSVAELSHAAMTAGIQRYMIRQPCSDSCLSYPALGIDFGIGARGPALS
jgi:hypothetical protein